jgi:probable HAF family extracellular repeat protein
MKANLLATVTVALIGSVSSAHATSYSYITLNDPSSDYNASGNYAQATLPDGINNLGQVVGIYDNGGLPNGFLYSGNAYTTVNGLNRAFVGAGAASINNSGQIVGFYNGPGRSVAYGFVESGGVYTIIPSSNGALYTYPAGINDSGQVVGWFEGSAGGANGFVYGAGVTTTFDFPGAWSTNLTGINNAGQTVGVYENTPGIAYGFLYSGGHFTTLSFPGSIDTYAEGINNHGQIVGDYWTSDGTHHGFLYRGGVYSIVDVPGLVGLTGINDPGQIVGLADTSNGCCIYAYGFLATPETPLPAAFPLFATGLGVMGLFGWRRKRKFPAALQAHTSTSRWAS